MSPSAFAHLAEIGERIATADLLFLDFDGTLAPLVDEPAAAQMSSAMKRILQSLSVKARVRIAIISGRARAELQQLVNIAGVVYAGNHGLEISGEGMLFVEPSAAQSRDAIKQAADHLSNRLRALPGTFVEDKGLTLSVHYRMAAEDDAEAVRQAVHHTLANASHPFVLTTGEKVFEVRPRTYWNKGTAVHWIIEQWGSPDGLVLYLGDDATDEDAFLALPEGITIRIGGESETAARYSLGCPEEVRNFLEWLDDHAR